MNTQERIAYSYRRMATGARYRPAAPSDGMFSMPEDELVLDDEAKQCARRWTQAEDSRNFHVGVCNFSTRPATILAIEAAHALCGVEDDLARQLLRMALDDLDKLAQPDDHA